MGDCRYPIVVVVKNGVIDTVDRYDIIIIIIIIMDRYSIPVDRVFRTRLSFLAGEFKWSGFTEFYAWLVWMIITRSMVTNLRSLVCICRWANLSLSYLGLEKEREKERLLSSH